MSETRTNDGIITSISYLSSNKALTDISFNNSTDMLSVNHSGKIKMVEVYSISGVIMIKQSFDQNAIQIHLPNLKAGIYIIKVLDNSNSAYTKKIIHL